MNIYVAPYIFASKILILNLKIIILLCIKMVINKNL